MAVGTAMLPAALIIEPRIQKTGPALTTLETLLYTVLRSLATSGMNMPDTTAMKPAIIAYSIRS
jgi:hypothetical protein